MWNTKEAHKVGQACEDSRQRIQDAVDQRGQLYTKKYALSIHFEIDKSDAAEDSKAFCEMAKSFGVENPEILVITPSDKSPHSTVRAKILDLLIESKSMDETLREGRFLIIFHYAGHGRIGKQGELALAGNKFSADSETIYYADTINPLLKGFSRDDFGDFIDTIYILDACHVGSTTRDESPNSRCGEVISAIRSEVIQSDDETAQAKSQTFTKRLAETILQKRAQGYQFITFPMLLHDIKQESNNTDGSPRYQILEGKAPVSVPLLSLPSIRLPNHSSIKSSEPRRPIRTIFTIRLLPDTSSSEDSSGSVKKFTDWLMTKPELGFKLRSVFDTSEDSTPGGTVLIVEGPMIIWMALDGLPGFAHVCDVLGPDLVQRFKPARQTVRVPKLT